MTLAEPRPATEIRSVFHHVTDRFGDEEVHRLSKPILIGLSWAIEDEFCARAEQPVLIGCFQEPRFWRPSRRRWMELARIADRALVLADFAGQEEDAEELAAGLVRVPVAAGSPMSREWLVVCDSLELPAALLARELPGQDTVPDDQRMFEALWTTEPDVVREASRSSAQYAAARGVAAAAPLLYHLAGQPRPAAASPRAVSRLLNRVLVHLDHAVQPRARAS